ncbi:MAG: FAD-dependent oxidoreductase [Methylophilales bacterium]|nr:FAD-dependent oxidoreductase [Methylophilales bacterium]|tara:strand:- start:6063 stop:7073 length:1011 start_codon:yes stop_codon:yes gene_type:complete
MKKIVVIGGGIVGCLSAINLKEKGFQVSILDQSEIGQESSSAAAGILFPLLPWDYDDSIYQLCINSDRSYEALSKRLIEETGCDPEFKKSGMLLKQKIDRQGMSEWSKKNQFNVEERKVGDDSYFYFPDVCQISPSKLMKALKKLMVNLKIEIIENFKLTPIKSQHKTIIEWPSENNQSIGADFYVLATGAWTGLIHQDFLGNIYPVRGQMIQFKKNDIELPHIIYGDNSYVLQQKDGAILAGSTRENVGFSRVINPEAINILQKKARSLVPKLENIELDKHWTGFRPGTNENLPYIMKDNFYENLFINSGHYRYGLTMAPESANRITKLIMQESI